GFGNNSDNKVCKLNKSLYGLKQAPMQWNAKLTASLVEHGFVQSKFDYSLFIKETGDVFVVLLVYVDDIVIIGNCKESIESFKLFLKNKFMIKDLGSLKYFLGIEVLENKSGVCLTQRKYCLELLHEYGLLAAKPAATPLQENIVLNFKENENDKFQFMHSPLQSHFKAALRVLMYLKGAPGTRVQFLKNNKLNVKAYSDADRTKRPVTKKSVSGFVVMIGLDISIENPNKVGVKYKNSSAIIRYKGEDIGNVPVPAE
ncbi:ribonuclease H-like domain-containing protein, partial [Tanacetum coccineum]